MRALLPTFLALSAALTATSAAYPAIILNQTHADEHAGPVRLLLFVPGGKVPPEDYKPFVQASLDGSATRMLGAIVHCGQLNLCDPLGQLPSLLTAAIEQTAAVAGVGTWPEASIIAVGHSLGGVGARHFFDTYKEPQQLGGLALLGTQYNGDAEDFRDTLGYPLDLAAFPKPLLALLGELDMGPVSHAAELYAQWRDALPDDAARAAKPVVIVPGMDHSQFCPPFNVSNDPTPEIPPALAVEQTSAVMAAWLDAVAAGGAAAAVPAARAAAAASELRSWVANATAPIAGAFLAARQLEEGAWCEAAQRVVLSSLPEQAQSRVTGVVVHRVNASTALEHAHTNTTLGPATGGGGGGDSTLSLDIISYSRYANTSWNPMQHFGPVYAGASDVACKMVSADLVAKQLGVPGYWPSKTPGANATCEAANRAAVQRAKDLLAAHWPAAMARSRRRGRAFAFKADSSTFMGPQWTFASGLSFDEGKSGSTEPAVVQSPHLYSSVSSKIYPGNFYCKLLSPAKAVEWLQTTGLTGRYK